MKTLSRLGFVVLLLVMALPVVAAQHCVVLQYHHVSENTPGITSVTPGQFQDHLDYLQENGFRVMRLNEVVERLRSRTLLPDKCVALSIDDAFQSAYTEAWPRVRRYNYPLTVFVSTRSVDEGVEGYMTWQQMREMVASGVVDFQNHSHSHAHLIRLQQGESMEDWEQRIAAEILLAQNRIERELDAKPTLFAYPYGEYNLALRKMVLSMGLTGFGQQSGPAWSGGNFGSLPRFPMNTMYASMRSFPTKVSSLPLPITAAWPEEPVVEDQVWQPTLTLAFAESAPQPRRLTCYVNGSRDVDYRWSTEPAETVEVTPKGVLQVGRNRYNCTLPAGDGRYHWYSHNWFRRHADGTWYREPGT
jgi:peptidoglycan/xylan/chitin deacetylase (PgdA/CDA1 family)